MTSKDVEKARPRKIMSELGVSALSRWDTKVSEEFLTELRGARGRKTLWQMGSCDPTLSAILFIYEQLVRSAEWEVLPSKFDSSEDSKRAAEFVDECLNDMTSSWDSTVSGFCSMFQYGFAVHEIIYKQRLGRKAKVPSAYNDNMIGIKNLPGRSQRSILNWKFDKHGGVHGCWQDDAQTNKQIWLPIEKILLFRTESKYNNPEGRSILASSYLSWYFLRNFREIEGISVERDLAGLPMIRVPAEILNNSEYATELQNYKNLISNVRIDEMDGIILPIDVNNPEVYKLELISSPGKKSMDIRKIIDDLKTEMAASTLTDLMFLGHGSTGSYALARVKQDALNIAVSGYLNSMASVINNHLIPKLMSVNSEFSNIEHYPEIVVRLKKLPSYAEIAEMIRALAFSSFHISADPAILNSVLSEYGFPLLSKEEYDKLVSNTVDNKVVPGGQFENKEEKKDDDKEDVGGAESLSIKVEEEED